MKKLIKICAAVGLIGACTGDAFAQGALGALEQDGRMQAAQAAVKDMAKEITECAVYFDIVAAVLLGANERATAQKYIEAHKLALQRADSLSPGVVKDHYKDMAQDMTYKVAMANIPKKIEPNMSNVSMTEITVLQNQYGRLCKEVVNDPGERAKYWMKQAGAPPSP